MANLIYTKFFERAWTANLDLDNAAHVVRMLLERSTSTYSPDRDHDFVGDLTNLVEISVGSYARQTVANKAVAIDDTNDLVSFDFDPVSFGNLESGQTVDAIILYQQTGGNDASPEDDALIAYIDTATGLPAVLGGGEFTVTPHADGVITVAQAA